MLAKYQAVDKNQLPPPNTLPAFLPNEGITLLYDHRVLFVFGRKSGAMPLVPSSFQSVNIFETFIFHLLCRPGRGSFAWSGAI